MWKFSRGDIKQTEDYFSLLIHFVISLFIEPIWYLFMCSDIMFQTKKIWGFDNLNLTWTLLISLKAVHHTIPDFLNTKTISIKSTR